MKIQVICENCNRIVELISENNGNGCCVQTKLMPMYMSCDYEIQADVNDDIEDIKNMEDVSEIRVDTELSSIEFRCKECGDYIVLNNLK